MANEKTRTEGTGKAGHHSSRWAPRAVIKDAAKRQRRREDDEITVQVTGRPPWVYLRD